MSGSLPREWDPEVDGPEGDSDAEARAARGQGATDVSKTERILNLVSFLLKERRPVPWREIAGRVVGYDDGSDPKSLERRFERDKAALKDMGVPVVYCPPGAHETEGYLIPQSACFLDRLELAPHEAALLDLLTELALRQGGSTFSADLMSALQKLRFDAPGGDERGLGLRRESVERASGGTGNAEDAARAAPPSAPPKKKRGRPPKRPAAAIPERDPDPRPGADPAAREGAGGLAAERVGSPLESSLLQLELAASLRQDPNLELCGQALLANRRIAFTYHSMHSGEKRRRELDPYGLGFSRGAWYVVGFDHLRSKIQQFRLDRIEGEVDLVGPERAFKPPPGFRVTEYLEKLPWEMADHPPTEVDIEVAPDIAFFVEDLIAGKGAAEPREDGGVSVHLEVRDRAALVRWVLAHLRHVRVLRPQSVKDEVAAAISELRRRHATDEARP